MPSVRCSSMTEILVVDDNDSVCQMLIEYLESKGHLATGAGTLSEGLSRVQLTAYDVVLLDVQLPDGNGLEYLPRFAAAPSAPEVIIMTGYGEPDGAEKAIVSGAWSYIEKEHVIKDLELHLTRALQYREEKKKVNRIPVALKRKGIIGNSARMNDCFDQLASAATSDVSVLITGETGTGKELFAKAIHENSNRAKKNFVVVDCASLPETLIENTLFGHVKGAFTGADRAEDGLIKHAHGGTLFLDEVGELPLRMQKTFLRVLQEHSFKPVGAFREEHSDFRLVAATNRNLEACTRDGQFRNDLLFRLQALSIELPPLRDRLEDLGELVTYFIARLCERYDQETKGIAPDFIDALAAYHWPGNVRELYQAIEQVFASAYASPTFYAIHLPEQFRILQVRAGLTSSSSSPTLPDQPDRPVSLPAWRDYRNNFEEQYVRKLMQQCSGDIKTACRTSGLSRTRLYQLLNKYELLATQS